MVLKISVMAAYFLLVVLIGIMRGRKTKSFNDFFLGGGDVGPWMTAFTYGAAYFSAVLFIGFAGKIGWVFGYSGMWIALFNAVIGVFGVWIILGTKIKEMASTTNITTMSEYLEARYSSKFLKLFSTIAIFVFFIPYCAAVFIGLSYLFKLNFNMEFIHALLIMGGFTAIYMVLGGYKSMAMIDVFFGIMMLIGGVIMVISIISKGGGLPTISFNLAKIDPKLIAPIGSPGLWPLFALVFLTSIAPFGMPQLLQKFYAVKDKKSIKVGMWFSLAFAIILCLIAYFSGSTTRVFLTQESAPDVFENGKPVFDALMPRLLSQVIDPSLSVFILLLILSASMSTLAALVLIASSALVKDFYHGFIKPNASDKSLTFLMRILSAIFILLSVILAYLRPSTIVSILGISWGAIGSVFLGPFVWGILSKHMTKLGAVLSSVLGLTICIFFYVKKMPSPEAGTIGMLVSLTVNPLVSYGTLLFKKKK